MFKSYKSPIWCCIINFPFDTFALYNKTIIYLKKFNVFLIIKHYTLVKACWHVLLGCAEPAITHILPSLKFYNSNH
uniref:Ras3 mRNA for ras protein n=1 Tax=Pararge aegeria TaxID=116150 RepID=S4PGB8_9NEOP